MLPVLLVKLPRHLPGNQPGKCSPFPKVKELVLRAGIEIFCCTIFCSPGGHSNLEHM